MARQSEDALSRAERINRRLETWRSALAARPNPRVALQMLDLLGANPFVTQRGAEAKLNLPYNTVRRAIGLLQEQGIVAAVTEARRGRVFCAHALRDILEEPRAGHLSNPRRRTRRRARRPASAWPGQQNDRGAEWGLSSPAARPRLASMIAEDAPDSARSRSSFCTPSRTTGCCSVH